MSKKRRPMITAPDASVPSRSTSASTGSSLSIAQVWRASPPRPSPCSGPGAGPVTNPSRDREMSAMTLVMAVITYPAAPPGRSRARPGWRVPGQRGPREERTSTVVTGVGLAAALGDLRDVAPDVGPGAIDVGEPVLLGQPAGVHRLLVPAAAAGMGGPGHHGPPAEAG